MVWWWPACLGSTHKLPPALGPHVPGYGDVMADDEILKDGLFIRIYYPTSLDKNSDHSQKWRSWLPDEMYIKGFAHVLGLWNFVMYYLYKLFAGDVKIPAAVNAPIVTNVPKLKTAVFSHGMGGTRFLYTGICCELAAHGYVVAAVEHYDESAAITWRYKKSHPKEKNWLRFRHLNLQGTEHSLTRSRQVQQRSLEVIRSLEFLRSLDKGGVLFNELGDDLDLSMFKGRLDFKAPLLVGHSFGGATALLTLTKTSDFKTGIILDPWMYPIRGQTHESIQSIHQPLLCINMQTFQIPPNLNELKRYTSGLQPAPRVNYTIRHSTHENQSDSVHLIGYWLNFFIKKIDPVLATHINNGLIIKFLREHGDLSGPTAAEECLTLHESYIVDGLTVSGTQNRTKKIPNRWLTIG